MTDLKLPPNMQEFNEITAVIFSQLYPAFPVGQNIDIDEVAKALGLPNRREMMPSGRPFNDIFINTLGWLIREEFVRSQGNLPSERVVLTHKAIAVMNAIPPRLSEPLGQQITTVANDTTSASGKTKIGEVMGEFFGSALGSFTKNMSGP
jgi:hypothetical protein